MFAVQDYRQIIQGQARANWVYPNGLFSNVWYAVFVQDSQDILAAFGFLTWRD
jgi:hypothetical protein